MSTLSQTPGHAERPVAHPVGGLSNRAVARMAARSRSAAPAPPRPIPAAPAGGHVHERRALREAVLTRATLQRDRDSDLEQARTFGGPFMLDGTPPSWADPGGDAPQPVPTAPPAGNRTPVGTVIFSNPIRSAQTGDAGGPCGSGHQSCPSPPGPPWPTNSPVYQWVIACGMDLSAPGGTEVVSAFDGYLSDQTKDEKLNDHVYGLQISVRSNNGLLGGWYTHLEDVPKKLLGTAAINTPVSKGERLGSIIDKGGSSHVHFAPGQRVNGTHRCLPELFEKLRSGPPLTDAKVTFYADGSAPTIS